MRSLWRSSPAGERRARWGDWAVALLVVWLGAIPVGAVLLLLAMLGSLLPGMAADTGGASVLIVALAALGWMLIPMPMLTGVGLLIALPLGWLMLRRGWGGWGSFLLLGLAIGGGAMAIVFGDGIIVMGLVGAISGLAFRGVLALRRPEIFLAA